MQEKKLENLIILKIMKTWKDLKVGDTIWYYDKWKMHPQVVTKIEPKEETDTYYDWNHVEHKNVRHYLYIYAGRRSVIELYEWSIDKSETWYGGMRRFCCKEAANEFLDARRRDRKSTIDTLTRQISTYQRWYDKYPQNIE